MKHLLIVDDEPAVLAALQRALRRRFGVALAVELQVDVRAALARLQTQDYHVVISDLRMPVMDGVTFLGRVAQLQPRAVRMILTGSADFATAQRAINESGVFRYLTKPWLDSDLALHLEAALAQAEHLRQPGALASEQELERRRLEAIEPGITAVEWGPGGEVLMPGLLDDPGAG